MKIQPLSKTIRILVALFVSSASLATAQQESDLWLNDGADWDPETSLLRDFTNVGYMNGDVPIPNWPVGINVTDAPYNAIPDDDIDDTQAFIDAIADCPANHAVYVPNGTYNIEQQISISGKSDFVLRGEDMYGAVLFMPYYLTEISGAENTAFYYVDGGSQCSIESLSFILRDQPKGGHWEDLGADPIQYRGVSNSWIRDVYIKNADHAIAISSMFSTNISVLNVIIDQYIGRSDSQGTGADGHMGITVFDGSYHLIDNVILTGKWHHDINAQGGKDSVWSRITGPAIGIDHHAMGAVRNLWTDIDVGRGTAWNRAGSIDETYWNIRADIDNAYPDPADRNVIVGGQTADLTDTGADYWHESITPDDLDPDNIYLAQMAKVGKPLPVATTLTLPALEWPYRLLADDDAKVIGGTNSTTNFGFDKNINLKNGSDNTDRQGFFQYDLSTLGLASVASAQLRIYIDGISGPPFGLQVIEINDDNWTEATLTYDTKPTEGTVIHEVLLNTSGWITIDVTSFVNAQLAGDQVVSLKLRGGATGHNKDAFTTVFTEEGGNSTELVLYDDAADVAAPAQPTGFAATPGDALVSLDWNDNAESDLASYNLYRATPDNSNYELRAAGLIYSEYEDISVSNGETYYYLVTAVDTGGIESVLGAEVFAVPVDPNNDPPAFTSDPIVEVDALESTAYTATLADDAVDLESDPMIFTLVTGPSWLNIDTDGNLSGTPGWNDIGLNTFTARVDAAGGHNTTTLEITVNGNPLAPPTAPTDLSALHGDSFVALDWVDNTEGDLASYSVYRSTNSGSYSSALVSGLTSSDYIDNTAINDTTYYYIVTAIDTDTNESAQSNEVEATPSSVNLGTTFNGGRTNTETDWSNGFPSSINLGGIGADGIIDNNSGFYVVQNGFTMNNNFGGAACSDGEWTLNDGQLSAQSFSTSNHLMHINGGTLTSTASNGDINIGSSAASTLIVNGGTVSTLDIFNVKNGTTIEINGGSVTVGSSLAIQDDSNLTISGGTLDVTGGLGGASFFEGTTGTLSFNGGTIAAGSLNASTKPASSIVFNFGGTTAGSVTASTLFGSDGNRTINWLPESEMSLTLSGEDEWAETEWGAGRLTYNGNDFTTLGDWATVTAADGLGAGTYFDYDSVTETLSLVSIQIEPPTGLTATPGYSTVSLDWDDNTGPNLESYSVYRSTISGGQTTPLVTGLATSDYVDNTAANGFTYYYAVTATNTDTDESEFSTEASAILFADTDEDGIDDEWEIIFFGSTATSDGIIDSDGDGDADFLEYLYGSIPTDASSSGFSMLVAPVAASTMINFDWVVNEGFVFGNQYQVLFSSDLVMWDTIPGSIYTLQEVTTEGKTNVTLEINRDTTPSGYIILTAPEIP